MELRPSCLIHPQTLHRLSNRFVQIDDGGCDIIRSFEHKSGLGMNRRDEGAGILEKYVKVIILISDSMYRLDLFEKDAVTNERGEERARYDARRLSCAGDS